MIDANLPLPAPSSVMAKTLRRLVNYEKWWEQARSMTAPGGTGLSLVYQCRAECWLALAQHDPDAFRLARNEMHYWERRVKRQAAERG